LPFSNPKEALGRTPSIGFARISAASLIFSVGTPVISDAHSKFEIS
jgi:hypothetical protein